MNTAEFKFFAILGLQSISLNVADNVSHPRRLGPTMELINDIFLCVVPLTWPP